MTSLRGGVLAVAALVLLDAGEARAYCRTTTAAVPANYDAERNGCITSGLLLFWKGACITYAINETAAAGVPFDEATRIIDKAFSTWTSSTCPDTGEKLGISVTDLGPVKCAEVRYNPGSPNQNLIVFRQDSWPYNDAANTLGLTTVTFNAESGEIYDADMEINASAKNLSISDTVPANGFDLLSVVTHEAGHFLGLAHATSRTATMFASYKPGTTTLRSLTSDDIQGVCSIYPNTKERAVDVKVAANEVVAADACDPTPRHGFTKKCEEPPDEDKGCGVTRTNASSCSSAVAALGGVGLIAASRRRRRPSR